MEGTMKQLIFKTKGEVELTDIPIPDFGPDGLLIKVAYAGICGSDVHGYTKGGLYGGIADGSKFGHEFVGYVVETGENVADFKEGDRVWVDPNFVSPMGSRFSCMAGGFAEYAGTVKAVAGETVQLIPDDLPLRTAALIEPCSVGTHCKNRAGVQVGDNVVIWGAGPIGLMAWASMTHQGVKSIVVGEQMPERIEFAKSWGVDVFDNSEASLIDYAGEKFGIVNINSYERANVDKYLDYVGLGILIKEYMEQGRPGSVFATVTLDGRPLEITPSEFMSKEYTVMGSRSYTPADAREVIEVLRDKAIDMSQLITGEFTLDQADAAFAAACDKKTGLKTVFRMEGE